MQATFEEIVESVLDLRRAKVDLARPDVIAKLDQAICILRKKLTSLGIDVYNPLEVRAAMLGAYDMTSIFLTELALPEQVAARFIAELSIYVDLVVNPLTPPKKIFSQ